MAMLRDRSGGASIWAGARYITPLRSRTVQLHDVPTAVFPSEVARKSQEGTSVTPAHYDIPPDVPVQAPVMGSFFLSDPSIFQSYFRVRWEGLFGARANLAEGTRRMTPNANPNARGRAEGQAILPYNPWPSASQINPQYPYTDGKAI
jgi:hypothetical protein